VLDENGVILPADVDVFVNQNNQFLASISPLGSTPYWINMIIIGSPNSVHQITIDDTIEFKLLDGLDAKVVRNGDPKISSIKFPNLVTGEGAIILPDRMKEGKFLFSIQQPISFQKSSFVTLKEDKGEVGWQKVSEEVKWSSPVDINLELKIHLLAKNENRVIVPLYLGNAYNDSWQLDVRSSSGNVSKINHILGNGFANLWLIEIDDLPDDADNVSVSMHVYWNHMDLFFYQLRGVLGILFFVLPFSLLIVRFLKFPKNTS